jgi:hypothetical protein
MKIQWILFAWFITGTFFLAGCIKNSADEIFNPVITPELPDLTTRVISKVNGFVTDENGNSMAGATVDAGGTTVITDQFGYFRTGAVSFPKSAGLIKINKPGYFTGFKTFIPTEGGKLFFRMQLVPKTVTGNLEAATGGTVNTTGGGKLSLPANAVVNAATGIAYSGLVDVSMHWFDPSSQAITGLTMPGDLRGISKDGYLKGLTTFGMLTVELYGNGGVPLQVAPGKQASLSFPIPSSLLASAPPAIPLWYLDESNGLWKEDGTAVKNGSNYEGLVTHFTPWNVDVPTQSVQFTAQLVNGSLLPLSNVPVSVEMTSQLNATNIYYTDSAGFISGMVPVNSSFSMKILTPCNGTQVIKTFSSSNNTNPVSLGTLIFTLTNGEAIFTGSVVKCNGLPVTDGFLLIAGGGYNQVVNIQNGNVSHTSAICPGTNASVIAFDNESGTQGNPQGITLVSGANNLGTVSACNTPVTESITYSIDGIPKTLVLPQHLFNGNFDFAGSSTLINAIDLLNGSITVFSIGFTGPATAGSYTLGNSLVLDAGYTFQGTAMINISYYGLIGEFITGSISATILDAGMNSHTFTCSIAVRRDL